MKKVVKKYIILLLILIVLQILHLILKNSHEITYKINNKYQIKETLKDNIYSYEIKINKDKIKFTEKNIFHKSKKTIKKIETFKKDNLLCIYPVYKNSNIICKKDNTYYSYYLVKDEIKDFVKFLEKKGYKNNTWKEPSNKEKRLGQTTIYNIKKDTYIYLFKYDGFYSINNKKLKQITTFKNDIYINKLGTLVDKYYIVPNYDEKYEYKQIYIYDITNNKQKTINLKKEISKDSYILGINNNILYIFDKENLIEYEINPKTKTIKEIGNKETGGIIYKNNKEEKINIYELKNNNITFTNTYKLKEEYDLIDMYDNYYIYLKDNKLYKYNTTNNQKTLLYEDIDNFKLIKDDIYFIKNDTLYLLDNNLYKVLNYSELKFNNENRIAIYKK